MSFLPNEKPAALPRENPFRGMARMINISLGRLPAHLVIIFFLALALTVLCGVVFRVSEISESRNNVYLPGRLSPDKNAAAVTESELTGTWVCIPGDYVVTLRIGEGVFEIVARYKSESVSRYFIRGGYRLDGDVLILQERKDLGTPIDEDHLEYKFYPLSLKSINFRVKTDGRAMTWNTPQAERARQPELEDITAAIFGDHSEWVKASASP